MPHLFRPLAAAGVAAALSSIGVLTGCDVRDAGASHPAEDTRAGAVDGTRYHYGPAIRLGGGRARAYVLVDEKAAGRPLELGVALDEAALEKLPEPGTGPMGAHGEVHEHILQIPAKAPAPFRFVELDWNPAGHSPNAVYTTPHFDFHFYTISRAARDSIDPKVDPGYEAKANRLPDADLIPEHYALPLPPGTPPVTEAVPRMGVHLLDMRTPEIQGLLGNHAAHRAFDKTFIVGSWDGRVTFWEPMITRAYLLAKKGEADPATRDEVIPLPKPKRYGALGHYPDAYRIAWDAKAKEYRVALTRLARK